MAAQREWFEKDYYKTLGVVPSASDKEITRAYRKLAKEHHPDANPGSEERFKEISAAYDVLGDAEKRKEYDEVRAHGPVGGGFGAPGGGTFRMEDMGDLSDLFGGLFGGHRFEILRRPLRLEMAHDLLDLFVGHEGAMHAADAAAAGHVEHVALAKELLGALFAQDGAAVDLRGHLE